MRTAGGSAAYHALFAIEGQVGADLTFSNQSLTRSAVGARNIIWTQGGATTSLGEIVAKDNSRLEGHFDFNNRFTGESITFQDSANMTGGISLEGNARITNGIAIQDSANMTGAITLAGSSAIANGITIGGNSASGSGNNATLTGNISLNGSSSISKILIDGSNMGGSGTNGTPKEISRWMALQLSLMESPSQMVELMLGQSILRIKVILIVLLSQVAVL